MSTKTTTRLLLVFLLAVSAVVKAQACTFEVTVGDTMTFSPSSMSVSKSQCASITVKLKHTGKIPKTAMGHNWVLAKTSDAQSIAQAGWSAGLDKQYLPPNDARVIASTKIIGGGETTSVTFATSSLQAGQDYQFFCSFVGHYFSMNGSFTVNP